MDHGLLFQKLLSRSLPIPVIRFFDFMHSLQRLQVQWGLACFSEPCTVSNGVRQGSVLSPTFFSVYLDGLLTELRSGVGCYWGCCFPGPLSYADDVVLLAPSASTRTMLSVYSLFAASHGLKFNANKTQLISLSASPRCHHSATIYFNGVLLDYVEQVIHILTSNLDDKQDIKDMNRKANSLLCTFKSADPFVKSFLY